MSILDFFKKKEVQIVNFNKEEYEKEIQLINKRIYDLEKEVNSLKKNKLQEVIDNMLPKKEEEETE